MINTNSIAYQIDNTVGVNPLAVTYNNVTLISDSIVRHYLKYKYGCFECVNFKDKFDNYNTMTAGELSRALAAWNAEYNPLDNYNGETTRVTTDDHGTETRTHKTGGSDGTHNKVTAAALTGTSSDTYTTSYDSTTARLDSQVKQSGGTETTDDLHTEDKTEHSTVTVTTPGGDTVTGDMVHTEVENKHGNLGVTTTQQMIMSEVEMRLNPVIKQYLDVFAFEYSYYVGGAWSIYDY